MRAFSRRLGPFPVISFSQIRRRIVGLGVSFTMRANNLVVGVDGTGLKVSNRGEWIRQKWAVRRGWVKVVLMGTTTGDIVDVIVGPETLNEQHAARDLLKQHMPKTALLDGLHDVIKTYDQCHKHGTTLVVPARANASTKGFTPRGRAVRAQHRLGHKTWVKHSGYGHRRGLQRSETHLRRRTHKPQSITPLPRSTTQILGLPTIASRYNSNLTAPRTHKSKSPIHFPESCHTAHCRVVTEKTSFLAVAPSQNT
jgi:hypothetical protein